MKDHMKTIETDGENIQIGKKWYNNTFSEEVIKAFTD